MNPPTGSIWSLLAGEHTPDDYYTTGREEIVNIIPRPPTFVVELGCGTGETGKLVKQRFPEATVIGIEAHQPSAAEAAKKMDRVLAARFEDLDLAREGIAPDSVDLFIAADVLEHLYNPWQVLRTMRPFLRPDAMVITSLPNVRNLALMEALADGGRWRYDAYGLLDVTHLRFFTKIEMTAMLEESGYQVQRSVYKIDPTLENFYLENERRRPPFSIKRSRFRLVDVGREEFKELCSIQILMVSRPAP